MEEPPNTPQNGKEILRRNCELLPADLHVDNILNHSEQAENIADYDAPQRNSWTLL